MSKFPIGIGFLTQVSPERMRYMAQMGAQHVVTSLPGQPRRNRRGDIWTYEGMLAQRKEVENYGLKLSVYEGVPVPERVKLGLPGRDEDIDNYAESLRNMGRAGIPILCYNWMVGFGWLRTEFATPGRGGAVVTTYKHEDFEKGGPTQLGEVAEEQLWDSLEYFLKAIVPVAEEAGVKLAMHPDDPPRSPVRGIGRIMTCPENFQRLLDLVPSPNNGLTFCQGCFTEMNIDVPKWIRHFAGQGKMHFAHYRNINKGGTADHFSETFHDEDGEADMYETMKAYIDSGFDGPMRPDHAPTMEGEGNDHPGYALQGRLMAVGYMKGLMEAIIKSR
ncbi:MAG: TIM barrel protein [Candidatus Latescibacteria bacterium]|nr:TIM barrel protein [Candidatus Latescibacterota bacterium]